MSGLPCSAGWLKRLFSKRTNRQAHREYLRPGGTRHRGASGFEALESRWLLSVAAAEQSLPSLASPAALFGANHGQSTDPSLRLLQQGDTVTAGVSEDDLPFQANRRDSTADLAIDPDLNWSTYLSGSFGDSGSAVAVDSAGNVLVVGTTTQTGWISGGFDTILAGSSDAFVAKLTPEGDLLWGTFLGGGGAEAGYAIAIDSADNIVVTGETGALNSGDWVSGGFDTTHNGGVDAFVVKLSSGGEHLWSTYLGGSGDDSGLGIVVDSADNILVTGSTFSVGWASGGFDTTHNGAADAFVVKLSPSGGHLWSTYLGGAASDSSRAIAVDAADNILITGSTSSPDWVSGGFDTTLDGSGDAFAAKLSSLGDLQWSTYLGGSGNDSGYGIAVDRAGNALVAGWTASPDWVSDGFDSSYNGGSSDAFVVKLSPLGAALWSTYVGGSSSDLGLGIAVDAHDNALITGYTASADWVSGGFDTILAGSTDAFVVKLGPTGAVRWSTYLGGSNTDTGRGIAVGADCLLVTGTTVVPNGTSTFVAQISNPPPMVVDRRTFYNGSLFDGDSPLLNPNDDAAVASDKIALLPGGAGSFANYTSYSRGINGIMIDIANLAGTPTASDFGFRVGNDDNPDLWVDAPAPTSIALHLAAGAGASSRIELVWADGAIKNIWLQITVKATAATGLTQPDVFYFGNAVGESGNDSTQALVNATDELGARANPKSFVAPAAIDNVYDFNRDGFVNATDQILARSSSTTLATALQLITVPGNLEATARFVGSALPDNRPLSADQLATGLAAPLGRTATLARISISEMAPSVLAESFRNADVGPVRRPLVLPAAESDQVALADQGHDLDEDLYSQIAADLVDSRLDASARAVRAA